MYLPNPNSYQIGYIEIMYATEYLNSLHASNYSTQFISSQLIFLALPSSICRIGVVLITFTADASPKPPPLTGMIAKTS